MSISADMFSRSFKARIIERLSFLLPERISDLRERAPHILKVQRQEYSFVRSCILGLLWVKVQEQDNAYPPILIRIPGIFVGFIGIVHLPLITNYTDYLCNVRCNSTVSSSLFEGKTVISSLLLKFQSLPN